MSSWLGLVGVTALLAGVVLFWRSKAGPDATLERTLLLRCRGNRAMVDRLIALELSKVKDRTREQAIRAAIRALERDAR